VLLSLINLAAGAHLVEEECLVLVLLSLISTLVVSSTSSVVLLLFTTNRAFLTRLFGNALHLLLSLVEEVLPVFHEVDLLEEKIGLLRVEALLFEDRGGCLLELLVGSFNLTDINLLFL
jgi:hypothetical protein